jgi:hypothetical protein
LNQALATNIVDSLCITQSTQSSFDGLKGFGQRAWQGTLFWLSGSGLPHHLLMRLREFDYESVLPPEILGNLSRNFAENQRRIEVLAEEFNNLNNRLFDAEVEFAAVRGFELSPDYCADLSLRTWYTHEYLVPMESIPRARKTVEQAGFPFRQTGPRGELCFAVPAMQPPRRVEDTYKASFPRMVVLHYRMWNGGDSKISVFPPEDTLRRTRALRWKGISFPTLAEDDLLIFLVADTFARVLSYWCKLSWFYEIANFLRVKSSEADFWARFYSRINGCGKLPELAGVVFLLASHLFKVELPTAIRSQISNLPQPLSAWVDHYGRQWALAKYPGSKLSLLLHGELVEDRAIWEEFRRHRLFPFPRRRTVISAGSSESSGSRREQRDWTRILRRLKFHGQTTYTYLRELPGWERLLNEVTATPPPSDD